MNTPFCAFEFSAILGESPIWSAKDQVLYWVDTPSCLICCFDPITKESSFQRLSEPVAAIALRSKGGLVVTFPNKIAIFHDSLITPISILEETQLGNHLNDAKCDRQGRLWCGTKNSTHPEKPTAALYCVDSMHRMMRRHSHVAQSNGMGWSPDSKIMYHTETMRHTIFEYDFDIKTGELSNQRICIKIDPLDGFPDGLTVDSEGYIWIALYGTGKCVRYSPQGKLDRTILLPVPHVTNCTFGGKELDVLYITTATENLSHQQLQKNPLSGSLFAMNVGVKGILEEAYRD